MIDLKLKNIDQLRKAYDPKLVAIAHKRAINLAERKAKTEVSRRVRARYAVKAKDVSAAVKVKRGKNDPTIERALIYTGYAMPLRRFSTLKPSRVATPKGRRYGAKARVLKASRQKLTGGFVMALGNGAKLIAQRKTKQSDSATKQLFGPSIPSMVDSPAVLASVARTVEKTQRDEFERQMKLLLEKAGYK